MSFSFDQTKGLIVVPTRLQGPSGTVVERLALDTGASTTMVSRNAAVFLGYDPDAQAERVQITTGSGVEYVPQIRMTAVQALGLTRENMSVLCHTLPPSATVDGVLGLDFFRGRRLVIDLSVGIITLE